MRIIYIYSFANLFSLKKQGVMDNIFYIESMSFKIIYMI